jgi:hypothetical protein
MAASLDLQYVAKEIIELAKNNDFGNKTLEYAAEKIVKHLVGSNWKDKNSQKFKELSSIVENYLVTNSDNTIKWKTDSKIMAKEIDKLIAKNQNSRYSKLSNEILKEAVLKSALLNFLDLDGQVENITKCLKEIYKYISDKLTSIRRMDIRDYLITKGGIEPIKIEVSYVVDNYSRIKEDEDNIQDLAAEFGFEFELAKTGFTLTKRDS